MWLAIKTFFGGLSSKLLEYGAIIASTVAAVFMIYQAGKKSEKANEFQAINTEAQNAKKIEDTNRTLPDGAAGNKLRNDWS